ncbi:MAG: hypothetical protein O7C67_14315, partial [Gammaproteobacteria bacterium]|nr:hypothetical protein [Gammaproteobacteria bacterium]
MSILRHTLSPLHCQATGAHWYALGDRSERLIVLLRPAILCRGLVGRFQDFVGIGALVAIEIQRGHRDV